MRLLYKFLFAAFAYSLLAIGALAQAQSPTSYTISGQVLDESGRAVRGVSVCAIPTVNDRPEKGVSCGTSGDDGKFLIRARETGTFKLMYEKMSEGYVPQRWAFYRHPSIVMPEITVNDESPAASALVTLGPRAGALTGKALDGSTNLPLENIQVTLCRSADRTNCYRDTIKSGDGKFRLMTSPEAFTVRIASDGFEDWIGPVGTASQAAPMFVASGDSLDLLVVMNRKKETVNKPISEAEKSVSIHLAAPVPLAPADSEKFDHYPRVTKLEWSSVEGAASYRLEVDYCQDRAEQCRNPHPFTQKGTTPITETSFEFTFLGAQAGRWRVWAVDKDGREGFKSPWRMFTYLH